MSAANHLEYKRKNRDLNSYSHGFGASNHTLASSNAMFTITGGVGEFNSKYDQQICQHIDINELQQYISSPVKNQKQV